jgi:protein-disulfide isomerase
MSYKNAQRAICMATFAMAWIYCGLPGQAASADDCAGIEPGLLANISKYIQKKFKLPPDLQLRSADSGVVAGTCFRKIKTVSTDKTFLFSQTLFLSPDHRALTASVLNLQVDPLEEERQDRLRLQTQVTVGSRPVLGDADADATIAIFSDFQCPFCKAAAAGVRELGLPGRRIRVVYRYLPLDSHSWARRAAEAGSCIFRQRNDAFWQFHDALFAHQGEIKNETFQSQILVLAQSIPGIDIESLQNCIASHLGEADVTEDLEIAAEHEINATPTFVLNGFAVPGAKTGIELTQLIESLSRRATTGK